MTAREKKYRLTEDIENEIRRLLKPETDTRPVSIHLRFGYQKTDDEASSAPEIPEALKGLARLVHEDSRQVIYEIIYYPKDYLALQDAYQSVESWPIVEVRIGGHVLPYSGNLWLPLLFFYHAEPINPFESDET